MGQLAKIKENIIRRIHNYFFWPGNIPSFRKLNVISRPVLFNGMTCKPATPGRETIYKEEQKWFHHDRMQQCQIDILLTQTDTHPAHKFGVPIPDSTLVLFFVINALWECLENGTSRRT